VVVERGGGIKKRGICGIFKSPENNNKNEKNVKVSQIKKSG